MPECHDLCDIMISTDNGHRNKPKQSVRCHKVVLMAASQFFRDIILQHKGKTSDGGGLDLNVSPVQFVLLNAAISFIYNGECDINDSNVMHLLELGVEWKLEHLSVKCMNYIKYLLTVDNVTTYYEGLTTKQCNDLAQYTTVFIRGHFTELCQSRKLNSLSMDNLCNILECDEINVDSEDVVFDCVSQWVRSNPDVGDVTKIYGLIRYQCLSRDYLCDVVLTHKLMQDLPQVRVCIK